MADDHDALLARLDQLSRHIDNPMADRETRRLAADAAAAVRDLQAEIEHHGDDLNEADACTDRLQAKIENLTADYLAGLDVIARLTEGWDPEALVGGGSAWFRDREEPPEDMSDREWRVYCEAAQRATRNTT
jgi:hypothetical protein